MHTALFGKEHDAITEFHGDVASYRDWRRLVTLVHSSVKNELRALTAPRILAQLRGEAWTATEHIDGEELRQRGEAGFTWLLAFLDGLYAWQAVYMNDHTQWTVFFLVHSDIC